jgi:glucose/arabinose dehydrogenase
MIKTRIQSFIRANLASLSLLVSAAAILFFGCGGGGGSSSPAPNPAPNPPPQLALSSFVSGLTAPLGFEVPNDGTGRLFIIEQAGTIRIIQNGFLLSPAFLDITAKIESGGEKGLLGLAFHPSFSTNRRFFINYTRRISLQLQSVISEFAVSAVDPNQADPASERQLLVVDQPFDNHNGGQLAFGPDGFLYIGFGDGGSGGDPLGNGQNLQTLLGKMLRIDVDSSPAAGKQYAIPADNPFASSGGLPEIWAYGFRNPWRFSFDRPTGRLFAGDVGQGDFEEVDLVTRGGNFGWNIMEGDHCYPPGTPSCNTTGLILPINEYAHDAAGGTAIIGGFVYHGSAIPGLAGTFVFGDLASGHVWGLQEVAQGNWQRTLVLTHNLTVSSFGQDPDGELYLIDYGNGAVLRLRFAP